MKDYKDHIDTSELFIFYKYENDNRIIVYASSYLEAKYAVLQFYTFGEKIFNLNEYLLQKVPTDKLFEILNIDKDIYIGYQFILSEYEYAKLEPYIINKSTSIEQHQKVLTKQFIEDNGGNSKLLPSTKEFINILQKTTINKDSLKNQINQLLNVVGDIWYVTLDGLTGMEYIFGKSRLQCQNLANKENKKYNTLNNPKLLINDINEITTDEIKLYKIMVDYIKANSINKFPFSTF